MNIQEYISSGVVESYVLGLASDEERREFEHMCSQYPEVLQARQAFEMAIEKQALQHAMPPAVDAKQKIWEQINFNANEESKIVSLSSTPIRKMNWWKVATAACVLLLAGSLFWGYNLNVKNSKLAEENTKAKEDIESYLAQIDQIKGKPNLKMASLKGLPASPQSYTTVYWDSTSHDVYLLVNNLPNPPSDKQYQLWALADGQPIDLGFIGDDYFVKKSQLLIKAKNVQKAQAFAITLETKNRPNPEKPAGDMYVMGNL